MTPARFASCCFALAWLPSCGGPAPVEAAATLGERLERHGDEIAVCGQLFHVGTPVVLWTDPGGYDAYRTVARFEDPKRDGDGRRIERARYGDRRGLPDDIAERVRERGWDLADLQRVVSQFVLHYDVCGTSRQCFKILQDKRRLSVHFMLDADGTIYQTLDLKERAWHAGVANDRSIGIEIAHIGAYPSPDDEVLQTWYGEGDDGRLQVRFPDWMNDTGLRTPGFVARPERQELIEGRIHGAERFMYDFTPEQHAALARLTAALHRILPRIRLDAPRDAGGGVLDSALAPAELEAFEGVLGHYHVTERKIDPGPALDWDRLFHEARAALE